MQTEDESREAAPTELERLQRTAKAWSTIGLRSRVEEREELRKWQGYLQRNGFPRLVADGIWGPNTAQATAYWQTANGLHDVADITQAMRAAMAGEKVGTADGLLFSAPRVALPSRPKLLGAGEVFWLELSPQRLMRGPYWLGLTGAEHVSVRGIRVGMNELFYSPGESPGGFFDARDPSKLVPLAGPCLQLGSALGVELYNHSCVAVEVRATLWGSAVAEEEDGLRCWHPPSRGRLSAGSDFDRRLVALASQVTADRAAAVAAKHQAERRLNAAFERIEALERRAPAPDETRECIGVVDGQQWDRRARAEADREATEQLARENRREAFEPGDAWETPNWEE